MAEDKKKETDGKGELPRKKGLPALVLVALGAVVGGAGVAFVVPPKIKEVVEAPKVYELVDITHPDAIQHEFNPRTRAGKGIVRVALKFVYTVREDLEPKAFAQIKDGWEQANSNVLLMLKTRSMEELQSEAGVRMLERDLIDDLDRTLFPGSAGKDGDKVAKVSRVIWSKWLMQ